MKFEIVNRTSADLVWPFEGENPYFLIPDGDWSRQEKVDPAPCYAHDQALVTREADKAALVFPIDRDVTMFITDRECLGRTNGYTSIGWKHGSDDESREWTATIVLSGKRIPLHPAMTRYLVAHEYGHVVAQYLAKKNGFNDTYGKFYEQYKAMRGVESPKYYGPGTWHESIQELFANDFRILVLGAETEFWPHPGFARPEDVPAVVDYWKTAVRELWLKLREKTAA